MKTLRARIVAPVGGPPIENGAVVVDRGLIVSVGPHDGSPCTDLGDVILLPGLINAHCHLDFTVMRHAILPQASFSGWVRRINDLKRVLSDDDYLQSISAGFAELARHGTTTVLNIESFPELMVRLPRPPLRTWWFYELLDIRNRLHTEEVVAGALSFFGERPGWLGGFGLSPHAPYTASPALYQLARFCCEKYGMPFMTHLAESDEEYEMFCNASGPLHNFLSNLGRNMSDTGGCTPVSKLVSGDCLPRGAMLTHMNHVAETDWPLLRNRDYTVIHCPRCHAYFQRAPFPMRRFVDEGLRICLGTDSLASNDSLDLFAEMQCAAGANPWLTPEQLLDMVTRAPAAALGMSGRLGELAPGACADLTAVPYSGQFMETNEAIVAHTGEVSHVFVAGEPVSFQPLPDARASA